jgi:pimeloyl-ACP methyl ester carboxylesterase
MARSSPDSPAPSTGRAAPPRRTAAARLLPAALLAAATLLSCAVFGRYDMARIHQESAAMPRNPVIVIPGLLGSKLRNRHTNESVWGRLLSLFKRHRVDDLSLPIDRLPIQENRDDLIPYDIYETFGGVKFYGAILDALSEVGRYRIGDINDPRPGDTCFVYYYDWRRDNIEAAIGLGRSIERIKSRLKNPGLRFDIVAHSMGGLVAEYYVKYGAVDVTGDGKDPVVTYAGAADIGKMVLIGTPRRGAMSAFKLLHTGFSRALSRRALFTMPSIYQLLPAGGRRFIDGDGRPLEADLHDPANWVRNRWSVFDPRARTEPGEVAGMQRFLQAALDRARAFRDALDRDTGRPSPVPIHLFGSDCVPTLDRVILRQTSEGPVTAFEVGGPLEVDAGPIESLMFSPGDGSVTARSLLAIDQDGAIGPPAASSGRPEPASSFFFCESHGLLPANRGFQDNLFYVLLDGTRRAAPLFRVSTGT